jgi:hypothetical protein
MVSKSDRLYDRYLDLGMPRAELDRLWESGTPENIEKYFGLKWRTSGDSITHGYEGSWEYDHGFKGVASDGKSVVIIGSLDEVATKGREPDFFELLKAGIVAGSVSKAFMATGQDNESPIRDSAHNLQIFQIGVNIIDGANPTQFPTCIRIEYGDGNGYKRAFYGAMDLPHWNGYCKAFILSEEAMPPVPVKIGGDGYIESVELYNNDQVSNPGAIAAMAFPMVWNPYDYHANNTVPADLAPVRLRVSAASEDLLTGFPDFIRTEIQSRTQISNSITGVNDAVFIGRVLRGDYGGTPNMSNNGSLTPNRDPRSLHEGRWYGNGFEPQINFANGSHTQPGASNRWTRENTALEFNNVQNLYRDPTVLFRPNLPGASGLQMGADNELAKKFQSEGVREVTGDGPFIGFLMCKIPQRISIGPTMYIDMSAKPPIQMIYDTYTINWALSSGASRWVTFRLEYYANGRWVPYEEIPNWFDYSGVSLPIKVDGTDRFPGLLRPTQRSQWNQTSYGTERFLNQYDRIKGIPFSWEGGKSTIKNHGQYRGDPRTSRFGTPNQDPPPKLLNPNNDVTAWSWRATSAAVNPNAADNGWILGVGYGSEILNVGWFYPGGFGYRLGAQEQNLSVNKTGSGKTVNFVNEAGQTHYQDPDQVVRRAMGGWVKNVFENDKTGSTTGLPMAVPAPPGSRPIILHRPYRTVAELGTVFRGTPWKNIDFSFPESGDSALLDIFCINVDDRQDSVIAGKVDLNTKQIPVLKALLAGMYRDEFDSITAPPLTDGEVSDIASALVQRTKTRPLGNLADLVGYYDTQVSPSIKSNFEPYDGFGIDVGNGYTGGEAGANYLVQRFRESTVRALSDSGQANTWNLMIDVMAQVGRYPQSARNFDDFQVDGERRYWVHLAIDRLTGQIIDRQIEQVNE